MTRSFNSKKAALTKRIGKKSKASKKPRGRSGTHRLTNLNVCESSSLIEPGAKQVKIKNKSWIKRLLGKK